MKLTVTLSKIHPLIKLLIWTVILGSVSYLVTENPFQFDDFTCEYVLYGTVCFVIIFILISSAKIFETDGKIGWKEFLFLFAPAYISTILLMVGETFPYYEINFWVCLVCWIIVFYRNSCIAAIGEFWENCMDEFFTQKGEKAKTENAKIKEESQFEVIILALSAAWSIALTYITFGTTIFDYGKYPITKLQEIHTLLDLRINLAIIIGILIAFKSMATVIQSKVIDLKQPFNPKEKKISSQDGNKTLDILLSGFFTFINLGITLIASFGNIFYKIGATILVYFYHVGGEIFSSIATLMKKSVNLIFYLFTFTALIAGFYFSNKISIPLLDYLRANSTTDSVFPLLWILAFTAAISICLITINYFSTLRYSFVKHKLKRDEKSYNEKLTQVMQTLPLLVFAILINGVLLFSLSKTDFLQFSYFKTFGIISAFLSAIIFVGFIIYLIDNFKTVKQDAKEAIIPSNSSSASSLDWQHLKKMGFILFLLAIAAIIGWYFYQRPNAVYNHTPPKELPKFDVVKLETLLKDAIAFSNAAEYDIALSALNEASALENIPQDIKSAIKNVETHVNVQDVKIAVSEIEKIITKIDK